MSFTPRLYCTFCSQLLVFFTPTFNASFLVHQVTLLN